MLIVTMQEIPGKQIANMGLVQGSVVQTKHIGRDIGASFKSLVGGEIKAYTELMVEARKIATDRMVEQAKALNADAIVAVRYITCSVMGGASEVMAYGTAVKFA
ncbi:MAG: heavy metal-binding domain-containing protein [Defluviitaleaceae bacterium]|nr:heavy metal-binding domain-containing protein [Defluviitaleaceae bacterium]